jgi:predicted acyltransferase
MILVNNHIRNYAYPPLEHSDWSGWTPTDLAFPTFLFVVGISFIGLFAHDRCYQFCSVGVLFRKKSFIKI